MRQGLDLVKFFKRISLQKTNDLKIKHCSRILLFTILKHQISDEQIKNKNDFQLERTPLHYAMGLSSVESLSRILIKNGAKRVLKDLKGRQPSYYFMNKADILRLQVLSYLLTVQLIVQN